MQRNMLGRGGWAGWWCPTGSRTSIQRRGLCRRACDGTLFCAARTPPLVVWLEGHFDRDAGRIGGIHQQGGYSSPLRCRAQSMPCDVLAGAYRTAGAAIMTLLQDGTNLVAQEYVRRRIQRS